MEARLVNEEVIFVSTLEVVEEQIASIIMASNGGYNAGYLVNLPLSKLNRIVNAVSKINSKNT